ncbi:MAG: YeeE/YedE family protein [Betaproteobacteria bacterium]|nr:MAG: YeeE/YedE family protein [Betaproteobacteria bacterium]
MPQAASAPLTVPLAAAGAAALALGALASNHGARIVVLFAVGIALGATLHHSAFGFASAYRRLIERRGTHGVRAQLLMLAAASALFAPLLSQGAWLGRDVVGAIAPASLQVAAGAFLFGIGMQLAGGCGSGTLYAAGGGQLRMAVTLVAFCAGSFWASLHMDLWARLPAPEALALGETIGWPSALTVQLAVLAALYALLGRVRGADLDRRPVGPMGARRILHGPWPPAAGALMLAALNVLTLMVAGHPWTITWAFTLWGAKIARGFGWSPEGDPFWSAEFQRHALEAGVLADVTSVMNLGLVIGAIAAAGLAGGFRLRFGPSPRAALAAALGGLAMGYGARIAYGCNVGAFFSGVASTSLHGWLWIAAALPGSWVALRFMRIWLPDSSAP